MADGRFPRPIKLGRRSVGWRTAEIERWLDEMQEASNECSLKTPPSQTDMSVFAGRCLFFGCRPYYYLTHHKLSFLALRARPKICGVRKYFLILTKPFSEKMCDHYPYTIEAARFLPPLCVHALKKKVFPH